MNLKNKILQRLFETAIFEMAYERRRAIDRIDSYASQIAEHLILISAFPENNAVHHWKSEVNAWLKIIYATKLKNGKRLDADVYFNILYTQPFEDTGLVDDVLNYAKSQKGLSNPVHVSEVELRNKYIKISSEIASGKLAQV